MKSKRSGTQSDRIRIAMVSEHASPLAALGGVDAGGQNVHVAELSAALARRGHQVRVYLPYGSAWFPYFMRRLGERPANVMFFLRSVTSRH